ncbi:hypothetical protein Mal64_10050 [Pseudobythopirellula maris]|uniref:Uncharacterized protein n=1 Tax=Pseudobythopirellula maris TaxID=2527991 RepID=A0A5C5ZUM2_9BACT|nr:hypothetical protein Mal64_10050 [Pseudobythopirellula maris]
MKIRIKRHHDRVSNDRCFEDFRIARGRHPQLANVLGIDATLGKHSDRRTRQTLVEQQLHGDQPSSTTRSAKLEAAYSNA